MNCRSSTTNNSEAQLISRHRSELMGLAMLWVILFHCFHLEIAQPQLKFFKEIGFCGVDIFILLSGMGQYVSLAKAKSLREYYSRRLLRILPAYWLVVGAYGVVLRLLERTSLTMIAWNLSTLQFWLDVEGGFNWYIPALLAFYLLAPFYVRLLRRCRHDYLLTVSIFPLSYLLMKAAGRWHFTHLSDFLYRLPAFALGCLLGRLLQEERPKLPRALLWSGLGLFGLFLAYARTTALFYISYCYAVTMMAVPLCVLLSLLMTKLPQMTKLPLRLLGTYSLEIYLVNVIFTVETNALLPRLSFGRGYGCYYAVCFLLTIPLAVGLHELLTRGETMVRQKFFTA